MAKKFNEHLEKQTDHKRMICMCKVHKKRCRYCDCRAEDHEWGEYHQLKESKLFTEDQIEESLRDYT